MLVVLFLRPLVGMLHSSWHLNRILGSMRDLTSSSILSLLVTRNLKLGRSAMRKDRSGRSTWNCDPNVLSYKSIVYINLYLKVKSSLQYCPWPSSHVYHLGGANWILDYLPTASRSPRVARRKYVNTHEEAWIRYATHDPR